MLKNNMRQFASNVRHLILNCEVCLTNNKCIGSTVLYNKGNRWVYVYEKEEWWIKVNEVLEQASSRFGHAGWVAGFGGGGHKWKSVFPSTSSSKYAVAWQSKTTSLTFTETKCYIFGETDLVLVLFIAWIGYMGDSVATRVHLEWW